MADLLLQHVCHAVGHRPHALADLRPAGKAAGKSDIDVPVLIGANPCGAFHVGLADHRPGFHRGVNLVARAVEEAGIDEHHARLGGADTFLQIDRRAPLLVHDAHLHGVCRKTENSFDSPENLAGEGNLVRSVHLRLHDVDGPGCRIAAGLEVGKRSGDGHKGVHDAFRNVASVGKPDCRVRHQMTDIANQHQSAGLQAGSAAVSRGVGDIIGEPAGHCAPALLEGLLERAAHQAKPVGVGENLVLGIDRRYRILAVHDARQRRFRDHVIDPRGITAPDGAVGIDPDHHM